MSNTIMTCSKASNGNTLFSTKVRKIGSALFLSECGQPIVFEMTQVQRQRNFDCIMNHVKSNASLFPASVELLTENGIFQIDAHIAEEIATEIFTLMVDEELGDLLELYPPSN